MWVAVVAITLMAGTVSAQETTGSVKGMVADEFGTPMAGAVVSASGPSGTVTATSGSDGTFRFPRLAPGTYEVSTTFEGYQPSKADVSVALGEATTVNFRLLQAFSDEIQVYSDTVAIDFTESQTELSVREWEIENLPRGRNFTDVVAFAAGTTEEHQGGGIMVDGATGLENRFVIDGLDTTDPQIGDSAIPMRADFMEEIQVKSAGYMAEYGGAMGGVINAVTKSGTNEFHGSVFVDVEDNSWNGDQRPEIELDPDDPTIAYLATYEKDDQKRFDPGFSLGGPIVRDRWWFFASYVPGIRTTDRYVDWASYAPDTYTQDYRVDYTALNMTANLSSALLLKAGFNMAPYEKDGLLPNPDGRADLPGQENYAPLGEKGERETYYLNADWIAKSNFVVSGRAGFYRTNVEDTGVPFFDLTHNYYGLPGFVDRHPEIPTEWQQGYGWFSNYFQRGVRARDIYEREAAGLDATWYFSAAGEHSLKAGYQYEGIHNDVSEGYNADRIIYYWDQAYTTVSHESVTGEYGFFRLLNIATFGEVETKNQSIFVQDSWSVLPNLTLNIGVRSEDEEVPNFGAVGPDPAIHFGWGEKIAPRLGFAWDVKNDARWKVYGSAGKYYDVTKYEMPRGSFGGARWVDYFYTFDIANPGLNTVADCRTGSNTIFEQPVCGAGTFIEHVDRRFNSNDPAFYEEYGIPTIDPNIKPMENFEAQIGVDHQLSSNIQIGARLVHKEIRRAIEDVGFLFEGIGEVYVISNPGEGVVGGETAEGLTFPKPSREYDALELTFDKRFSDNWSLRAYYTLSRLYGNYSGLANTDEWQVWSPRQEFGEGARLSPNVSRLYDSVYSYYNQDGEHEYGLLATNRTHQLGAQFLYSFPFGFNVGVNQYLGSGTPMSTIGTLPIGNEFYPFGRGDLGETSWLTQTDLSLYYTFTFGNAKAISVGLTVLNLFDEMAVTQVYPSTATQDVPVTADDVKNGFDYASLLADLGPSALDVRYRMDNAFQMPREIRFSLKFEF
jgi:hypothetical protein